jgi:hypothetical protein
LKTVEAIYCVPGDRPVVQLFVPGGQWGELRYRAGRLELELFAPEGQSWLAVDVEELLHVIALAKDKLVDDQNMSPSAEPSAADVTMDVNCRSQSGMTEPPAC